MADNKKYYYMRLKENFFETDEMIYLESLEEGYLFSNILLKLYLRSLKNEGILMMNEFVPYDARLISKFTGHSLSTVEKALFEFKKLGLIELLDSGQMYMSHIELFVGKTTTEADRKRLGRKKAEQKLLEVSDSGQMSDKCPPEIELEKEKELEKDIKENEMLPIYKNIIDHLNMRTGKRYRHQSKSTQESINARLKEGFTIEDFYKVIDVKSEEWLNTENDQYLTPDTLFRPSKFEKYLNQKFKSEIFNNKSQSNVKSSTIDLIMGGNGNEYGRSEQAINSNFGQLLTTNAKNTNGNGH